MPVSCTGVILAGGQNKRFGGQNKAFIRIGGRRIVDRLLEVYDRLFDQIVLVTNDPAAYMDVDALIVSDHYSVRSSLTACMPACSPPPMNTLFCRLRHTVYQGRVDSTIAGHGHPKSGYRHSIHIGRL